MPTLDGQDDAMNDLISARQWKQALNLCEKKLKKANNSDYLLVRDLPSPMTNLFGDSSCSSKRRSRRSGYCFYGRKRHVISKD